MIWAPQLQITGDLSSGELSLTKKGGTKTNSWVWTPSAGVGDFHMKGWGPKNRLACLSKPTENIPLSGTSQDDCQDIPEMRGAPKSLRTKSLFDFWPLFIYHRRNSEVQIANFFFSKFFLGEIDRKSGTASAYLLSQEAPKGDIFKRDI